jgi:hypothetical protein
MFEHMKGYPQLFAKIATWLKPKGKVFIHVFVHKDTPYEFEDDDGWMSKHFFSGGTMPSVSVIRPILCVNRPNLILYPAEQLDLFTYFQSDIVLKQSWYIPGTHYAQTLESWLKLQDSHKVEGMRLLEEDAEQKGFGRDEGRKSFYRYVISEADTCTLVNL